jgi:limonene-1,2-epoxide hydrolase
MASTHSELVRKFCLSLAGGDMTPACQFLHPEVYYHNQPLEPMIGTAAVYDWLQPFVDGTNSFLTDMKILHQVSEDNIVMNAREETWQRRDICVMLPVAGVFVVEDDLITRGVDYWDLATFQPILDDLPQ